jgi:glutathione-dependent formaldehyde-activating enzyme
MAAAAAVATASKSPLIVPVLLHASSICVRTIATATNGGPTGCHNPSSEESLGSVSMPTREAACHCGQLRLEVTGDPFVVSICHCLACQRRTGSAFGMQAAFRPNQVNVSGRFDDFTRVSERGTERRTSFTSVPTAARRSSTRNRPSRTYRRLGRLVRRPVVPATDRIGVRVTTASLGRTSRLDPGLRPCAVGARATPVRSGSVCEGC